ncbi:regulator of G-protein signaling 9-binding protein [Canis lupus familiaris]|uniref:Regulator of G protein signaling 9 binding protein n=1 Tax=Canis lupus familiaris TaxID=9615 RepID=A0A8C0LWI0_CANLF|nr:regulator of G-protein signaling 9-binding protein [Canis lupus familiaris]XP_038445122.1 regulator of G-protein signaling 9-binding protein-like [Canis lupus familiaris]
MAREECKALLDALNRTTARHHQLALTVGGSADSRALRRELRRTRREAQELAAAARARLTAPLRDRGLGGEERAELERLWAAFSGCLDLLEADMRRALALGSAFPLQAPRRPLVRTGVAGGPGGPGGSARSLRRLAERDGDGDGDGDADGDDLRELEREVLQLSDMIRDMEMKVNVPRWTVQARQTAGAELLSAASSAGPASVQERSGPCDPSKALAAAVFSAVLLAAVALAVCVAKLS